MIDNTDWELYINWEYFVYVPSIYSRARPAPGITPVWWFRSSPMAVSAPYYQVFYSKTSFRSTCPSKLKLTIL